MSDFFVWRVLLGRYVLQGEPILDRASHYVSTVALSTECWQDCAITVPLEHLLCWPGGQTEEAHLEELKGRRTFGRERLLAIFWSLLDAHLLQMDDGTTAQPPPSALPATPRDQQSAAVLGHLAGLLAVRALLQVHKYGCILLETSNVQLPSH